MDGVVILGAGLAGLGCARLLRGARVFEAEDHPGGLAHSSEFRGIFFDRGAHICHSKDRGWLDLVCEPPREIREFPQSKVSNYWHGSWVTYPVQNHLHELPLGPRLASLAGFVLAHARKRGEPRSYREWCLAQYGPYLTEHFYAEYTRKYWRTPMEDLATDWLSGRLLPSQVRRILRGALAAQPEVQSAFASFRYPAQGGFFEFVKPLYEGLNIRYGARAVRVDTKRREVHFADGRVEGYETLASSIPLPELVAMVKDAPAEALEVARSLRDLRLLCVNMIVSRPGLVPHHWFYIYDGDVDASRISVVSNLAPQSVPEGTAVIQAEVFRRQDEPARDEELTAKAVRDLGRVLGFDPDRDVAACGSVVVPHSYVISDHRRGKAVAALRAWLAEQGIHTMGLPGEWKFLWSDAAFRSGEAAARAILDRK